MLPWLPAFLHRHFPPQSPPSHPLHPSLCSQQQPLPWDCSTRLKLQLPATAPSRGPAPVRGMYGCSKDCLILIPFMLSQISCFPLSLKCFSSGSIAPCGDQTPASVPPPAEGTSSPTNTPVFPPRSFILPSFAWVYTRSNVGPKHGLNYHVRDVPTLCPAFCFSCKPCH